LFLTGNGCGPEVVVWKLTVLIREFWRNMTRQLLNLIVRISPHHKMRVTRVVALTPKISATGGLSSLEKR
jgi:hypothetical protein